MRSLELTLPFFILSLTKAESMTLNVWLISRQWSLQVSGWPFVLVIWNKGCERRTSFTRKDKLFMELIALEHGQQWNFTAILFGIHSNTFERLITMYM